MFPLELLREPVWQPLTWTLLHFVWQGLAVAVAVAMLLYMWPVRRAHSRYLIYLSALTAMAVCPLVTFMVVDGEMEMKASVAPAAGPEFELVASEMRIGTTGPAARESDLIVESPDTAASEMGDSANLPAPVTWKTRLPRYADAIQPYCLMIWMAGVLLLAVRLSLSWRQVRRLRRGCRVIPTDLAARATVLGRRLGLRFHPRVCVSQKIREAIVVGLWRPLVLLPASWLTEMTPEVLEAVIAHELAHVRRLDLWVNLLQRLMETLLFYHPAVWWLSRRVSLHREMCADELAVAATSERLVYATALEQLGRMRLGQTTAQFGAGMGGNRMVLLSRVGNILGMSPSANRARWWPAGLLALAVPAAIWLASTGIVSTGIVSPTENETRAEEVIGDAEDASTSEDTVDGVQARLVIDLINAVGVQQRPSFWIGRERLTREALLDRLGKLRQKWPTLQVAVRHTASTEEKELTALRQSLAKFSIRDVSIGRHDLPHVFAYANGKHDGTIRGRVVDAHPTVPSPKYNVMLWHKRWESMSGENPSLLVGAGEAFEFRTMGPGDYELRTREWRPADRVVRSGADQTYVQTKAAVEDGKVTDVQVVFGKDDTGRWTAATDSTSEEPEDERAVPPSKTTVRGRVVDDVTGEPVARFATQGGKFDPADPAKITWGYTETRSSRTNGKFSATVRWPEGWTARIIAAGYLPQPVLTEPPGQDVVDVVIRLKRGDTIRGRVLDHKGKGVARAGVYLAGPKAIRLTEGPYAEHQRATVHTDAEGRFEIAGRGKDSKAILVTAPSLYVWRADLPEPGKEAIIRLPEPARLHIRYDIEGGPPTAEVRIELCTWDMPKWKGSVNAARWVQVKPGADGLVVDNLPPGVYDISRRKLIQAGDRGQYMMLDRRLKLALASGKTTPYDLVRKTGTPIAGDVVGLPKEGVDGVFVCIRDHRVGGDPRGINEDWKLPTFDGLALEGNGSFMTERIPPGKYKVIVKAYRQETPEEKSRSGIRLPKWIATADVEVPESGEPPKARLTMRPYDPR